MARASRKKALAGWKTELCWATVNCHIVSPDPIAMFAETGLEIFTRRTPGNAPGHHLVCASDKYFLRVLGRHLSPYTLLSSSRLVTGVLSRQLTT